MSGGKADLGLNVALMFPHYFQYNQHPEPLSPSIALYCPRSGGHSAAGSGPARRQIPARPGPVNYYQQAGLYYQLYRLKKSPPAAPWAADGPVKVQCPLAGSNRRPEH